MSLISYRFTNNVNEVAAIFAHLKDLNECYPDFEKWYFSKVIPEIETGVGSFLIAEQDDSLIGIGIGKKTIAEKKLRCIRVLKDFQHKGIGPNIIDKMLQKLECDKPIITVSEELINLYSRIFVNDYKFSLTEVLKGTYRQNKLEYVFNDFIQNRQ